MKGTYLKFYVHENRIHDHTLLYEWLLERAEEMGINGGSAFRAIAGFGRHGLLDEGNLEMAGDLPVEVVFMVSDEETQRLLEMVKREGLTMFYLMLPAEYGVTNREVHKL